MKWVVVRTAEHVDRLLADAGNEPLFALTAPGAAAYAGPKFLQALCAALAAHPHITPVIDCGDDPGLALRALEVGWRHILFSGDAALFEKLRSAGESVKATVYSEIV